LLRDPELAPMPEDDNGFKLPLNWLLSPVTP
jgi:hypothetical protein